MESSGPPVFLKHTREKSLDRPFIQEHPKSPDLLRKVEPKAAPLIADSRHRYMSLSFQRCYQIKKNLFKC